MMPLASSRSNGRAGRFHAAGSTAPVSASPRRHHSWVSPSSVAPYPLPTSKIATSSRPWRTFVDTTSSRLPSRLWRMTECWLDSGLVTRIGRPSAISSPGTTMPSIGPERSTMRRRHERRCDRLGQPDAGEQIADPVAEAQRGVPVGRHRRVRRDPGNGVVAADPRDLLGDVGLDHEVASPGRDHRASTVSASPGSTLSGCGAVATGTLVPAGAASVTTPTRASSSRCSPADTSVPSSRSTRAGRKATRVGAGSWGPCRPHPSRPAPGPLRDQPRGAVRAQPRQPMLLALLEPEACLGSQRVAERGPPDRDRIEDRRLDDDVAGRVRDLGARPAHDPGDGQRALGVRDQQRVRRRARDRRGPGSRGARPDAPAARRSDRRGRPPRRRCGSACRAPASRSCSRRRRC